MADTVQDDTARVLASCDGRIVSDIVITPRDPSFLSFPRLLRPFARGVGLHHTTTKRGVIGAYVLLDAGEACTEEKRAETERILRRQPFLTDATVRAVSVSGGRARIEIETVDEIPTVLGMRLHDMLPSALRFGNGNVAGQGLHLAGRVERGFAYRTGVGVEGTAYQMFGRPYRLSFTAERDPLGSELSLALGRPFFTDLQRTAWHLGFEDVKRYRSFVRPEGEDLSLEIQRRLWNVGGVRRLGLGRRAAFVGALVTAETVNTASVPVVVSDSGFVADTTGALGGPVASYLNLRLNAVVGVRALSFLTVRGFDALSAVQDVAVGLQLGAVLGWGTSRFGDHDRDFFVAADLYAGRGSANSFAGLQVEGEARQDPDSGRWDSMMASGRLAWYVKPADAHVLVGSLELGGAWRQRIPLQLRLGDRGGGVRGYGASRVAGAVRTLVRLEERWFMGTPTRHGELGVAGFVDAGRVWAGGAPFGVDSPVKVGAGIGLLAAVPPGSRRLWRLDLAVPVSADPHAGWEVRLTVTRAGPFWRDPDDVARARAGAAPSTIFGWH
ncbi:MAG TPA: hypothetical protein VLL48_10720 [Longimicrobiales bacterium]|nr:hypothetical protein [Longimicrobiales bacterium]